MKILLSAFACEPGRGSEPGVGWNIARSLAEQHQVWVLTSRSHQAPTEAELARHPVRNLNVTYFDPFGWTPDWSRRRFGFAVYLHYYLWQVQAYFVARKLHRDFTFDVVNHVTYMKYSTPSFVSLLPIPFFLGPVGGGESAPAEFRRDFSAKDQIYELERDWARRIGECDPFVRLTVRRSALVWATTEETARRVRRLHARRLEVASGMGLDDREARALEQLPNPGEGPFRFLSTGRLLHWKGFHLALRAFAEAGLADAEYWILGDGPDRKRLEAIAAELGIAKQVRFWGELERQGALARMGECHVLVHPSLHDSGGWVCLEAMAAGRPVVCLDLGGPAVQVTDECGFRIPARTPVQAVHELASAMTRLATDRDLCRRMGAAGQRRVKDQLSWARRAEAAIREFERVR